MTRLAFFKYMTSVENLEKYPFCESQGQWILGDWSKSSEVKQILTMKWVQF